MATLEQVAQQSQGRQFQQNISSPRGMGALQSLAPQYQQETGGKYDSLAKDLDKLISKGWEAVEQDMDLTDKATEMVANDMLVQHRVRANEIDAMEITTEEKRARYLALNEEMNSTISNTIDLDNDRQVMVFDNAYTNKAKVFNSEVLSGYDKQITKENILTVRENAISYINTVGTGASGISLQDYKQMNEYAIRLGGVSEAEIEAEWIKASGVQMEAMRGKNNNQYINTIKTKKDYIRATVGEEAYNAMDMKSKVLFDKQYDKINESALSQRMKESDEYTDNLMLRAIDSDSTVEEIDSLIGEANSNIGNYDNGKMKTAIAFLKSIKTGMTKTNTKDLNDKLKSYISNTVKNKFKVRTDNIEGFVKFDKKENAYISQNEERLDTAINAAKVLYGDDPEKLDEEVTKINEAYSNAMRVSIAVNEQDIFAPNNPDLKEDEIAIVNELRETHIGKALANQDYANAARGIQANNKLPKGLVNGIRSSFNSKDINKIVESANVINELSKDGTVKSLINDDSSIGDVVSFINSAISDGGLSESEIETIEKINSGEKKMGLQYETSKGIVKNLGITNTTPEYQALADKGAYLLALGVPLEDTSKILEEFHSTSMYNTNESDTEVFTPPVWAKEDVIDKTIEIITDVYPSIAMEGTYVTKDKDDNMMVYQGQGDRRRLFAIMSKDEYLGLLSEFRTEGKDSKYNEYKALQEDKVRHRNHLVGKRLIDQHRRNGTLNKKVFESINSKWFDGQEKYIGDYKLFKGER
jgi:hypothetical protein